MSAAIKPYGVAIAFFLALSSAGAQNANNPAFDVILRNGTIIDGTGGTPYRADVAIRDARIVRISNLSSSVASLDIDVRGLHVAPGFINLHLEIHVVGLKSSSHTISPANVHR